jgi:hypothetical protein
MAEGEDLIVTCCNSGHACGPPSEAWHSHIEHLRSLEPRYKAIIAAIKSRDMAIPPELGATKYQDVFSTCRAAVDLERSIASWEERLARDDLIEYQADSIERDFLAENPASPNDWLRSRLSVEGIRWRNASRIMQRPALRALVEGSGWGCPCCLVGEVTPRHGDCCDICGWDARA